MAGNLRPDEIRIDALYSAAAMPGLYGLHHGVSWEDGVAAAVTGPAAVMLSQLGFQVFQHGADVQWLNGRAVEMEPPEPLPEPPPKRGPGRPPKSRD